MDTRELRAFVTVAETGSITRAAVELKYAQSSVTAQVRRLEKEIGAELFDRLPGSIRLSEAGERLLPLARQILATADRALGEGNSASTGLRGTLVVGTMESIASFRLYPLVEHMHLRHPDLRMSMRPSLCADTLDGIRRGSLDCGFFMEEQQEFPGVEAREIVTEPLVLVCAPGHRLLTVNPLRIDDLRQTRVVGTEPGCVYRDGFERVVSHGLAEATPVLEFGSIDSVKKAVASGLGIALLPRVSCTQELADGTISVLPWESGMRVSTYLAWRRAATVPPAIEELLGVCRRIVAEQQVTTDPS